MNLITKTLINSPLPVAVVETPATFVWSVGHRSRGFLFNFLNPNKMNNLKECADALAQAQAAEKFAERTNRWGYNWDELADHVVGYEPAYIADRLLRAYFTLSEYYLKDEEVCGSDTNLYNSLWELRCLHEIFKNMTNESGERKLSFAPVCEIASK